MILLYAYKYMQRYNKIMFFCKLPSYFLMQISYLKTPAKILILEIW